jgi:hypothetical protein
MISLAMSKNSPFTKIYCLDTSRFGRDQHETQTLLYQLRRKHGIACSGKKSAGESRGPSCPMYS